MKLTDAIDFWVTESGYRQVQNYLSRRAHSGSTKYALANNTAAANNRHIGNVVETLRSAMEPAKKQEVYYRGSPSGITNTHRREGFFAVAYSPEKAESYGKVFRVYVDADVPRIQFGAEGGEVLLADGMVYEYPAPDRIHVRTPTTTSNAALSLLGNLYSKRKAAATAKRTRNTQDVMSLLYCYSLATPDEVLGYGDIPECDKTLLETFSEKPIEERITLLAESLTAVKEAGNFDLLKDDIPLLFSGSYRALALEIIESMFPKSSDKTKIGGYRRRNRSGHKTKKQRRKH